MKKKLIVWLTLLASIFCLFTLSACEFFAFFNDDGQIDRSGEQERIPTMGLAYKLSYSNDYYIVTGIGMAEDTDIVIPSLYQGKPVIYISDRAFDGCDSLTSIIIPDSVTEIGKYAFSGCESLSNIVIPDSVTEIGKYVFSGCDSLTSVIIPDSVTEIGEYAFNGCESLANVTIPDSVTEIGEGVFKGCKSLVNVTVPDSVISIAYSAFEACSKLQYNEYGNLYYLGNENNPYYALIRAKNGEITSCNINEQTKIIASSAFEVCNKLQYNEYDNAYYLGNDSNPFMLLIKSRYKGSLAEDISHDINERTKFIYPSAFQSCYGLTSIVIPDSVTHIGNLAFDNCNLTSVKIGNSVTYIGKSAFDRCRLTSVTIPDSVTHIDLGAFNECGLTGIIVSENNANYKSINGNLYSKDGKTLIQYTNTQDSFSIPNSVTCIGASAFYRCAGLKNVVIPNSVTSISDYAFYSCTSLMNVTIPNSVTYIGEYAFANCQSFTNIVIPDSVTSIEERTFI